MKTKVWLTGWILSFCITFGSLASLVTAFDLSDVALPELSLFCMTLCALCCWAFLTKWGPLFLFSIAGGLVLCCLFWLGLWQSFQAVVYELSTYYDAAYGWGILSIPTESESFSQIPAVYFFGMFPAILISWAICQREKLLFSLSFALIPLYPCFVVVDTNPEGWCFFLILGAVLILVLTQSLRRLGHQAGTRITAFALIPVILLSAFLVVNVPQEGYWSAFPELSALLQPLENAEAGKNPPSTDVSFLGVPADNKTDLTQAGPLSGGNQTVMKVRSGYGGYLYLRYQSFDHYSGTLWTATNLQEDPACWPTETELAYLGSVAISSTRVYEGMFIPYYANDGCYLQLQRGKLPNADGLKEYRVSVGILPETGYLEKKPDLAPYLELPDATREAALEILQANGLHTPEDILEYVKNSADYSLQTPAMPQEEGDFALWFLESSETGYCTHFATAAAVLLRAAGYPARYVTGYALMTNRGVHATVTEQHAHAWVEYSDPNDGYFWQILEATPVTNTPGPGPEPTEPPTEAPTQPTTVPTQPTTQPTTVPTQPTTLPSAPTAATGEATLPTGTQAVTTASPTTQAPTPEAPGDNGQSLSRLWPWLIRLGSLLAVWVVLWLQYRIRYRLRQKKLRTGTPNRQALNRWQEILRLSRLLKTEPPEALLTLAEKAKFSQHTSTKEELFQLGQYLQQQRTAILGIPVWKRLFLRLIWAI